MSHLITNKRNRNDRFSRLKIFDAEKKFSHQFEVLSSFIQNYFAENVDIINILEAGCGQKWQLDLGDINYKLTGVDINKNALEIRINQHCPVRNLHRAIT